MWGRESFVDRVDRIYQTAVDLEWFNLFDENHLKRVDMRLNQNFLIGMSVEYLESGSRDYAKGYTLWDAISALVPRALWPDKPVFAGSPNIVSDHTGLLILEGTSVGVGHVMEFYINFGTIGVICGFVILGTILAIIDFATAKRLLQNDWHGFTLWFLPAMAFLNVGGSLVELTATAAAGLVVATLVNKWIGKFKRNSKNFH